MEFSSKKKGGGGATTYPGAICIANKQNFLITIGSKKKKKDLMQYNII